MLFNADFLKERGRCAFSLSRVHTLPVFVFLNGFSPSLRNFASERLSSKISDFGVSCAGPFLAQLFWHVEYFRHRGNPLTSEQSFPPRLSFGGFPPYHTLSSTQAGPSTPRPLPAA